MLFYNSKIEKNEANISQNGETNIVIDEISLTSRQHIAYSRALSTLTECPIEKQKILHTPFGGLHVIIVGDFCHLMCIKGTPSFSKTIQSEKAFNGQKLWGKTVTEYI